MRLNYLIGLIALLALILVAGCERKVVNETASDENLQCFTCHGDQDFELVAAKGQWEHSIHASGNNADRNRNYQTSYQSCEQCHTNEGFVANLTGAQATGDNFSAIGCFTCHAPHTNGTLALRVTTPVTLLDGTVFDKGAADLCASCHQSRVDVRTYVADSVKLSSRFGPHHGPQGDMLVGGGGYEYSGYTYTNSAHTNVTPDGCIDCHMKGNIAYAVGGHTFRMADAESGHDNFGGCNVGTCHNGTVTSFDVDGVQTEMLALLDTLKTELVTAGLMTESGSPSTAIVKHKDSTGAVFNWTFVESDRSEGVHNTEYARGLLRSSINFLRSGNPNGVADRKTDPFIARSH